MPTANNNRQQRISQERRKRRAGGFIILLVIVFLLFCISHGLFRVAKDGLTRYLLDYEPAVAGEVEAGVDVKGIIIRPEVVVNAPVTARFENVVINEARIRKGTVIGHLYPVSGGTPQPISAPATGMVVFGVDGLESALQNFDFISCSQEILDYTANFRLLTGAEVNAGQPLLKIVDNLTPLKVVLGFKISDFSEPWESGKQIVISHKDKRYKAEVTQLKGSGGIGMALLTLPADDQLGKLRTTTFTVVTDRASGVTVSSRSLVRHGSGIGLYQLKNGSAVLVPVEVVCRNNEKAVVTGINNGDLVLTNPERIRGAEPIIAR